MKGHEPQRRCVGCRKAFAQGELIRLGAIDGLVRVIDHKPEQGRSIYLCKDKSCYETALKKRAFVRMLQMPAELNEKALREDLSEHICF